MRGRSARRLFGRVPGLVGGLAVALSPFRHYYAQTLLSESLAELLLVGGVAAVVLSADAAPRRLIAGRLAAGAALGADVLTRANLAPVLLLAALVPPGASRGGRRMTRLVAAAGATLVGGLVVLLPWLEFNRARGVLGVTGSTGFQMNQMANQLGVGSPQPGPRHRRGVPYDVTRDGELTRAVLTRFAENPADYAIAVGRTAGALLLPWRARGDVAQMVAVCRRTPGTGRAQAVVPRDPMLPAAGALRCSLHAALCTLYAPLVLAGWIGLLALAPRAAFAARGDLIVLAAIPLAGLALLCLTLQWNTRYAFPFDTLALAFGLPGLAGRPLARPE